MNLIQRLLNLWKLSEQPNPLSVEDANKEVVKRFIPKHKVNPKAQIIKKKVDLEDILNNDN